MSGRGGGVREDVRERGAGGGWCKWIPGLRKKQRGSWCEYHC